MPAVGLPLPASGDTSAGGDTSPQGLEILYANAANPGSQTHAWRTGGATLQRRLRQSRAWSAGQRKELLGCLSPILPFIYSAVVGGPRAFFAHRQTTGDSRKQWKLLYLRQSPLWSAGQRKKLLDCLSPALPLIYSAALGGPGAFFCSQADHPRLCLKVSSFYYKVPGVRKQMIPRGRCLQHSK